MTQIDLLTAEKQFMKLIELAASGEEIVISKNNLPIAKISPADQPKKQRQFGSAKGLIEMAEDFDAPLEDFQDYM